MPFECFDSPPNDYISGLVIKGITPHVIVTAWDGTLSLYNYEDNDLVLRMRHHDALTSCAYSEPGSKIFVGSVSGEVLEVDFESERFNLISEPAELGISALCCSQNNIIAGSWDGSLQIVDSRSGDRWFRERLDNCKILGMDCADNNRLVVSLTGGKVAIYDLRNMIKPQIRESGLKFQTRDIKLMPAANGYVQSSLDGRVAVEYFDQESSRFAFRCHRMNLPDTQFVFPVNSLCFNSNDGTLYTGGSDGRVYGWNLSTRKKSHEFPKFEDSIVKLAYNNDVLCVATGDDSFKTLPTVEGAEIQPGKVYFTKL